MMKRLIVISGPVSSGKSTLANSLSARFRFDVRRTKDGLDLPSYKAVRENPTERQVDSLRNIADVVIDTQRCTIDDILVRAGSHLRLLPTTSSGYVDVVVGGQYGSEGKGQISAHLSKEYDLLVRVGGPNAGHAVFEEPKPYKFQQLPSGTRKSQVRLLLGPGSVIDLKVLLREIAECQIDS